MELSASKIFKVIFSHIWIIILTAVVFAAAGFAYSHYRIPPTYTSSMKLMVTSEDTLTSPNEITAMIRMVNTYVEMLDSRDFYELVKEDCQLRYSPAALKSMITYTIKEDSEAFTVTVVAGSAEECSTIINSLDEQAHKYVREKYNKLTITSVESPSVPYESSSTNRNTILAFLIGFVLSCAIVFIWNELDVRIKSEEDLGERYDIPILGVVPTFEVKKKHRKNAVKEVVAAEQEVNHETEE